MSKNSPQEPLFRSVGPDGKTVMLLVGEDGTWTITRDGQAVADGTGDGLTIAAAVRKFRSMVHPPQERKMVEEPTNSRRRS